MRRRAGITLGDFEKALDEFFDEMLISRWRRAAEEPGEFERSRVVEQPDHYQVCVEMPGADPERIEVKVVGQRLSVRVPSDEGYLESSYSFAQKIDQDRVSARWTDGTLVITLPKHKPRQIKVKQG